MENFDLYKSVKVKRFELSDKENKFTISKDFDEIDSYQDCIYQYIYTGIKLSDHTESKEKAFQSRLQLLMSVVLLRSILLKNGIVESLNHNNIPSYYAILKSFLEVQALLGNMLYVINKEKDLDKIISKIEILKLGNRVAGNHDVGNVKALNVETMFKQSGKVLGLLSSENGKKISLLTEMYGDVCNFSHINFNAHLCIAKGGIHNGNIYNLQINADEYKKGLYPFYMPAFVHTVSLIEFTCGLIARDIKVNNFNLLDSKHFFNQSCS